MKASRKDPFILTAAAAALLLAFGPAMAQDDSAAQLTKPQSSINVGVGYVSKDNQRFGQYNGLTDKGAYGIVDFSLDKRDDSTGTWFRLQGRDLGYKDPELRLEQRRQGDWGYYIDYTRIPRYEPYTVNTGLQGVGTTSQTVVPVTPGAGTNYQLDTKRDRWTIGLEKAYRAWNVQVRYRNEEKDGSQLWSQGRFGAYPRFLAKPIDYTMQQVDVMGDYNTDRFQVRVGYYGSMFDNHNKLLTASPDVSPNYFGEMSLPPDNQSHQFYVSGGYSFTDTIRSDFKVSYGRATQNDSWAIAPPAGVTATSLDGRVDTTLVQAGVSGRATSKFTWRADLRYENRDDKTPQVVNASLESYQPRSIERTTGKVIGHYSLPNGFRLTGDITYDQKKREVPELTVVDFRETVNEATYRLELRRAVSQTVTGALSVAHSKRDGSEWLDNRLDDPTFNIIAPIYTADRDRNTVRLVVNWMPSDPLAVNFRADESRDDYTGRNNETNGFDVGPREGKASNYSLDASYVFSESVTGTAWLSHGDTRMSEATCQERSGVAPNPGGTCQTGGTNYAWVGDVKNLSDNFGLGLRAKATSRVDVGADVTYAKVRDEYGLSALDANTAAQLTLQGPLPDITTKVTTVRLYGKYALDRKSGVRVDYVYDQYQTDDWTWSRWIYADGTTVLQDPNQKVNYVGVSYYYKFQ
jgi:MtrB/PioB family decaheme-associated outer membrane protein